MPEIPAKDLDLGIESTDGWLGKAIQWVTRSRFNHVFVIFHMTKKRRNLLTKYGLEIPKEWLGQACTIEAQMRVSVHLLAERVRQPSRVILASPLFLDARDRDMGVRLVLEHAGQRYGVIRLLAFLMDLAAERWSKLFFWRRRKATAALGPADIVCSYLAAMPYAMFGHRFCEKLPRSTSPADIAAHVQTDVSWDVYFREINV